MKFLGYIRASDGKYYKYNLAINGKYYCPGNIIVENGTINKLEPEKNLLIDNLLIDLENKTIRAYDNHRNIFHDSFLDAFKPGIEKIEVVKDKQSNEKDGEKIIRIQVKGQESLIEIQIDKNNQIIGYKNEELRKVDDNFLCYNEVLRTLDLPNLQEAGNDFLFDNEALQTANLPNLQNVGDRFLFFNKKLQTVDLPKLQKTGEGFLWHNEILYTFNAPNLESVGDNFLLSNNELYTLKLPSLQTAGNNFLFSNGILHTFDAPNLERVGDDFLHYNEGLDTLKLKKLQNVGGDFLHSNEKVKIELPNLKEFSIEQSDRMESLLIKGTKRGKQQMNNQSEETSITTKDLAILDKDKKLTTRLIESARKFIEKLREKFNPNDHSNENRS